MYYAGITDPDHRIFRDRDQVSGPIRAGSVPWAGIGPELSYPFSLYFLEAPAAAILIDEWGLARAPTWTVKDVKPGHTVFGRHGSHVDKILRSIGPVPGFNAVTVQRQTWNLLDGLRDSAGGRDDTLENVITRIRDQLVSEGSTKLGRECVIAQRLMSNASRASGIGRLGGAAETATLSMMRTAVLWAVVRGGDNPFRDVFTLVNMGAAPILVGNGLSWARIPQAVIPREQMLYGRSQLVHA